MLDLSQTLNEVRMDSARENPAACADSGLKQSMISSRIFRGDTRTGRNFRTSLERKAISRFAFAAK